MRINQGKPCHGSNYTAGRGGNSIRYIVIHFTSNDGDTAQNNCSYFAGANRQASAHYFVGNDGIYQSVQDKDKAWHCGGTSVYKHKYCRNANSIGIEMCSRISKGHYVIDSAIVDMTVELTRYLMNKYNVPLENVIRHYDVWDKDCPEPFVRNPEQWINFKNILKEDEPMTADEKKEFSELKTMLNNVADKQKAIDESLSNLYEIVKAIKKPMIYNYIDENMPEWAREGVQWCVDNGIITGTGDGLGLDDKDLKYCTMIMRIMKKLDK